MQKCNGLKDEKRKWFGCDKIEKGVKTERKNDEGQWGIKIHESRHKQT